MEQRKYKDKPKREPLESAEVSARRIAKEISKHIPKGWCFTLVLASKGHKGYSTYISNIKREDSIKMLGETVLSMIDRKEI